MLVLTRKHDQSIMIGDDIEITVVAIGDQKVRLGIEAPRDIPVHRAEVYLQIKAERGEAVAARPPPSKRPARKAGPRHV